MREKELSDNFERARILEGKLNALRTALTAHTDAHLTKGLEVDGTRFITVEQDLEKAVKLYDRDEPISQEEYTRLYKEADTLFDIVSENIHKQISKRSSKR